MDEYHRKSRLGIAMHRGKRYANSLNQYDRYRLYSPAEAIDIVKRLSSVNFDETVELAVRLGVDPRRADQIVRGTIALPAGTGKVVRVAVFAAGESASEAREAGADVVGSDDLVNRIMNENFLDFDVAIATPDLMGQVSKVGRILGPRGLMPNPKTGTVTTDIARTVSEFKSGRVEYRTDRVGNVHVPIGKISFPKVALLENVRASIDELIRAKPAAAKGKYIRSVTLSSTMGPGVKVDPSRVRIVDEDLAESA